MLDEPTAALDAETEHALFERYAAAAHGGERARALLTAATSLLPLLEIGRPESVTAPYRAPPVSGSRLHLMRLSFDPPTGHTGSSVPSYQPPGWWGS